MRTANIEVSSLKHRCINLLSKEESGVGALEYVLIVSFVVIPCMSAILMFEDIIREYLGFEVTVITAPFF